MNAIGMAGNDPRMEWSTVLRALTGAFEDAVVVLAHEGPVDHATVDGAVAMVEAASMEAGDAKPVRKRLVNVLIEAMENLHRHVDVAHRESVRAVLLALPGKYRLIVCNAMPVTTAALLSHRMEVLNDMDDESLKEHYIGLLGQEGRTERGGAGMGLVTIARRSMRPMVASTQRLDDHSAYFCLDIAVDRS